MVDSIVYLKLCRYDTCSKPERKRRNTHVHQAHLVYSDSCEAQESRSLLSFLKQSMCLEINTLN